MPQTTVGAWTIRSLFCYANPLRGPAKHLISTLVREQPNKVKSRVGRVYWSETFHTKLAVSLRLAVQRQNDSFS